MEQWMTTHSHRFQKPLPPTFVFYKALSLYQNQYTSGLRVLQAMDKVRFWESCVFKGTLTLGILVVSENTV